MQINSGDLTAKLRDEPLGWRQFGRVHVWLLQKQHNARMPMMNRCSVAEQNLCVPNAKK
jgi:hypothetical protein